MCLLACVVVSRTGWVGGGGGVLLPCMGYIGMCGPEGYGFSAVLVRNRVSILAILVRNGVWFLHTGHELTILGS